MAARLSTSDIKHRQMWKRHPELLNYLSPAERRFVVLRYGLGSFRVHTLKEIRSAGEAEGLSPGSANPRAVLDVANRHATKLLEHMKAAEADEALPPSMQLPNNPPIEDLGLGTYYYTLLKRSGFDTINELLQKTAHQVALRVLSGRSSLNVERFLQSLRTELAHFPDRSLYLRGEQSQS